MPAVDPLHIIRQIKERRWAGSADLRPGAPAAAVNSSVKELFGSAEPIAFFTLSDVVILGKPSLLMSSDGQLLAESLPYPSAALESGILPTEVRQFSDSERKFGSYLFLDGQWSRYYWHWVMEYLPRAILAERAKFDGFYVVADDAPRFVRESLNLVGVSHHRILSRGSEEWWVESALILESFTGTSGHGRKSLYDYPNIILEIRKLMLSGIKPALDGSAIYVTRKNAERGRHLKNEAELLTALKPYHVQALALEELPLRDQLALISGAKTLIGPHGAGMLQALFMPPKSLIIEFYAPNHTRDTNAVVMELLGHQHVGIVSDANPTAQFSDAIVADISKVESVLKAWSEKRRTT